MFRLALPSQGYLAPIATQFINLAGLNTKRNSRAPYCSCSGIEIVFVHPMDTGRLVEGKYVDMALTAQHLLLESRVSGVSRTLIGRKACRIALLVQQASKFQRANDLAGRVVATSYPNLTRDWFSQQNIDVQVFTLHESVEIGPRISLAAGITCAYRTGASARANGLRVLSTIMDSEVVLVTVTDTGVQEEKARVLNAFHETIKWMTSGAQESETWELLAKYPQSWG